MTEVLSNLKNVVGYDNLFHMEQPFIVILDCNLGFCFWVAIRDCNLAEKGELTLKELKKCANRMVHVCYAIYDKTGNFSRIAAASLQSLYDNTEAWLTVHILHDNTLSEENKEKYIYQARMQGQNIVFYNMDELLPDMVSKIKANDTGRFSPATMYRLLLMHVLPKNITKVIYLDCDTIVNLDIEKLYNEPTGENGVAAVAEIEAAYYHAAEKEMCNNGTVKRENYFCAGILMFEMEAYRNHPDICFDGIELLKKHPEYDCNDQDILNYYFADKYYHLPVKYDTFVEALRYPDIKQDKLQECIYHYAAQAMDLTREDDVYKQLFFDYYIKTPWFDGNVLLKVVSTAMKARYETDKLLTNIMRDRNIVFCGCMETDLQRLKDSGINCNGAIFFGIYDDKDAVIVQECLGYLEQNKKDRPLLLVMRAYPFVNQALAQAGYEEGTDYINADFLMEHDRIIGRNLLNCI